MHTSLRTCKQIYTYKYACIHDICMCADYSFVFCTYLHKYIQTHYVYITHVCLRFILLFLHFGD